ncbi:hypothetical protein C8046_11565 [Serinibacter arcticus]|uniref:Uncharacterized protein n=1 Tax=Serinibacter arcticus TaxID=1655435 RepID=A0A2U1ZW72_9MICO|nr:hypothetical protein [Serinibacter arcticus]PWD51190.1 hypothetical protein C8046_11565 [Serinibacter arcticus]
MNRVPLRAEGLSDDTVDGLSRKHKRRVLTYLRAGRLVVASRMTVPDRYDGGAPPIGVSFRTDGAWVWSEETIAYLERHDHRVPHDLEQRARQWSGAPLQVSDDSVAEAAELLRSPGSA